MPRLYRKSLKVGLPPGTLLPSTDTQQTLINLIDYNVSQLKEEQLKTVEESFEYRDTDSISWINIDGRDPEIIKKIDEHFGVHPLVLEDIINTGQRPKIEDYGDYLFFVIKMIYFDEKTKDIYSEQIGLVLGKNFVISFQERSGDVFDAVRERIRASKGKIRQLGADYLTYALLDAIVDHYFVILERIGERIDKLEDDVSKHLDSDIPAAVHRLKKQVIFLKKQIWPLREVLSGVERIESNLIDKSTEIYLRDVYDHTIQVNDTLEAFRDALSGLHDIYLSSISNRMNEVMKVLTIFAAIFIPLTFICGVYGMNFEYIPELRIKYGYFYLLGVMATVATAMLIYFKRKKWM